MTNSHWPLAFIKTTRARPPCIFQTHAPEGFEKAPRSRTLKPVKPHGKPGGIQRTPLHACDKAANQDLYDIIAERQEKVCLSIWCAGKDSGLKMTPGTNRTLIAGAEDYIARFVEEIVTLMNGFVFIACINTYSCNTHCRERKGIT